jgi:hypothetical protein
MKWLIIQSDGEHKGQDGWTPNWYLRECYAIQHALSQNGQEADIWGLRHSNYDTIPDFNSYDFIFCIENYETGWLPDLHSIMKPKKLQWIIDLHCQSHECYDKITQDVDIVLHSTKSLISDYERMHSKIKHVWFPNGVDDRYFNIKSQEKSIDFSFVGSKNPARKDIIEFLETNANLYYRFATGSDMIDIVSKSKVHFNKGISCDVNYRNFETIGLGTCLYTNHSEEIEELGFKDGYNCVLYKDESEIVGRIADILRDDNYKKIAANGAELARKHSYVNRINDLLKIL